MRHVPAERPSRVHADERPIFEPVECPKDTDVHEPVGVHFEHLDVSYEFLGPEALAGLLKGEVNAAERRCRRRVGTRQECDGSEHPEPSTAGAHQKRTRMR
jgi:hypothetical protein